MSAADLLRRVVAALDASEIPHMLVGSFASMSHGAPRATQDIDLVIRKDRPFSRTEFGRRLPARALDVDVCLATAEDTILAKLEWAAMGGSDRQVADAATVIAVRGDDLDDAYLDRWAAELGVTALLARARGR